MTVQWHLARERYVTYYGDVPTIVCLCGSTRFAETFIEVQKEKTIDGEIVLTIEVVTSQSRDVDPQHSDPNLKVRLDELHKRKIDLADYVYVIDVDHYIGESTRSEINYARELGKPIIYMTDDE